MSFVLKQWVKNGIISITILNYNIISQYLDPYDDDYALSFGVSIKYKFPDWFPTDPEESVPEHFTTNRQLAFDTNFFFNDCYYSTEFSLKVPLLRLSYDFQYRVQMICKPSNEFNQRYYETQTKTFKSDWYTAHILPMFIGTEFTLNDRVTFQSKSVQMNNALESGIILQMNNALATIQTEQRDVNHVIQIPQCKLFANVIDRKVLILSYTNHSCFLETVLCTNDIGHSSIHCALCNIFGDWFDELYGADELGEDGDLYDAFYSLGLLSVFVCKCLFTPEYELQIQCPFSFGQHHGTKVRCTQLWNTVLRTNHGFALFELSQVLLCRSGGKSRRNCSICKIGIEWHEFVFICDCVGYHSHFGSQYRMEGCHVYCVWCIQSMCGQYQTIKPLLFDLLSDTLDENCIEQIVMFCVGKAASIKIEKVNKQQNESNRTDDTKSIGSKRKMESQTSDSSVKKRRIE
eukprot:143809_1